MPCRAINWLQRTISKAFNWIKRKTHRTRVQFKPRPPRAHWNRSPWRFSLPALTFNMQIEGHASAKDANFIYINYWIFIAFRSHFTWHAYVHILLARSSLYSAVQCECDSARNYLFFRVRVPSHEYIWLRIGARINQTVSFKKNTQTQTRIFPGRGQGMVCTLCVRKKTLRCLFGNLLTK